MRPKSRILAGDGEQYLSNQRVAAFMERLKIVLEHSLPGGWGTYSAQQYIEKLSREHPERLRVILDYSEQIKDNILLEDVLTLSQTAPDLLTALAEVLPTHPELLGVYAKYAKKGIHGIEGRIEMDPLNNRAEKLLGRNSALFQSIVRNAGGGWTEQVEFARPHGMVSFYIEPVQGSSGIDGLTVRILPSPDEQAAGWDGLTFNLHLLTLYKDGVVSAQNSLGVQNNIGYLLFPRDVDFSTDAWPVDEAWLLEELGERGWDDRGTWSDLLQRHDLLNRFIDFAMENA